MSGCGIVLATQWARPYWRATAIPDDVVNLLNASSFGKMALSGSREISARRTAIRFKYSFHSGMTFATGIPIAASKYDS
jgi:hypothetical protein